jgi:hypothetical protein
MALPLEGILETILVVEDDEDVLEVVTLILKSARNPVQRV